MAAGTRTTFVLLGVIGAVYLLVVLLGDWLFPRVDPSNRYALIRVLGAKNNAAIEAGEYWRLGTSIVLHGNLLHLIVNAYALYVLGAILERLYGVRRFLLLFLLSGLGGALASYWFTAGNSVGASGAIFGLLGGAIVYGYRHRGVLPARIRRVLTVGLLPWVALNIVIGVSIPQIDNAAHMGGMVTGAALALVLGTPLKERRIAGAAALQWVVLAVLVLAMAWSIAAGIAAGADCLTDAPTLDSCYRRLTRF